MSHVTVADPSHVQDRITTEDRDTNDGWVRVTNDTHGQRNVVMTSIDTNDRIFQTRMIGHNDVSVLSNNQYAVLMDIDMYPDTRAEEVLANETVSPTI